MQVLCILVQSGQPFYDAGKQPFRKAGLISNRYERVGDRRKRRYNMGRKGQKNSIENWGSKEKRRTLKKKGEKGTGKNSTRKK